MANVYVDGGNGTSTGYWGVTIWSASLSVHTTDNGGRGTYVRQTAPANGSERVFRLTTPCTGNVTGGSEPSWITTHHGTTSDNSGVWTECTGDEVDMGTGTTFLAPHARVRNAAASGWSAAGDTIYCKSSHTETQSTANTINTQGSATNPINVICISGAHVPPVSGDAATGATITQTGTTALTLGGTTYWDGLTFSTSSTSIAAIRAFNNNSSGAWQKFKNCSFTTTSTSNPPFDFSSGVLTAPQSFLIENCTFTFNNQNIGIGIGAGTYIVRNITIAGTTTSMTKLFDTSGVTSDPLPNLIVEASDLSGTAAQLFGFSNGTGRAVPKDCKLNSATIVGGTPTSPGLVFDAIRCDSGTETYRNERYTFQGTQTTTPTEVRTGGTSDGVTAFAWKIVTTANNFWSLPFEAQPIAKENTVVSSNVTVTWYGVYNGAALPNNDDIWGCVEYLGSTLTPIGTYNDATKASIITTNGALTADTSDWDSEEAPRQNSHSYSVGAIIAVASNPGRIFWCTASTGNTASSEPGGYATAVDGGSVTDGSATFRAGMRFSQAIVLSTPQPGLAGYIYLYLRAAKVSSTYIVDPQIYLS